MWIGSAGALLLLKRDWDGPHPGALFMPLGDGARTWALKKKMLGIWLMTMAIQNGDEGGMIVVTVVNQCYDSSCRVYIYISPTLSIRPQWVDVQVYEASWVIKRISYNVWALNPVPYSIPSAINRLFHFISSQRLIWGHLMGRALPVQLSLVRLYLSSAPLLLTLPLSHVSSGARSLRVSGCIAEDLVSWGALHGRVSLRLESLPAGLCLITAQPMGQDGW